MTDAPSVGAVCWVRHSDKTRPAVVLEIRGQRAHVIVGTRTQRPRMRLQVRATSPVGRLLRLSETTYFYPDNQAIVEFCYFEAPFRPCPPGLFLEIRKLLEDFAQ